MNSSEVAESLAISTEAIWIPELCGAAVTTISQLAPATTAVQPFWTEKSAEDKIEATWMVTFPVLERVTVWGAERSPTVVAVKASELCDRVKVSSGAALAGLETTNGPAWPVKLTVSGLDAASLSMVRVPALGVATGELVPVTT